jgi:hypothetical protein
MSPLIKEIIIFEKLFLQKPKRAKAKLKTLLEDNTLKDKLPDTKQIQNYIYRYGKELIAKTYPKVKEYLSEIWPRVYSNDLKDDDVFAIFSNLDPKNIQIILSMVAFLLNLINQARHYPSSIHIDGTFKLIDIGLPLLIISTENIDHEYRPIWFMVAGSESTKNICVMIQELTTS